jgi:putative ABC transport system permease protein
VIKTLGFSGPGVTLLVLAEALLITVIGGAIGLGLATVTAAGMAQALQQFFPFLSVPALPSARC